MLETLLKPKEKKVEYVELIYDLIFVYIIGRNNSLLHNFSNGFVDPGYLLAYIVSTLAVIQIWNYSTYYINIYGRHSIREHVFLFINMFLLYFIAESTRSDWHGYELQYHIAWALILVNIGVQYLFEIRNHTGSPENRKRMINMALILFGEAVLVAANIWVYQITDTIWLLLAAILLSMGAVFVFAQKRGAGFVDFPHLSERAMLYVVFTFGEMIIAIASYFEGEFSLHDTYFALMAFLIVVGLFLSYGVFYDHIIDREQRTNGLYYMFLHIFLIFALNGITNGLEFMTEEEISLIPKLGFLVTSFELFFIFLFALGARYAKARFKKYNRFCLFAVLISAVFTVLMYLLRNDMMLNIGLTVVFVFSLFAMIYHYGKEMDALKGS